jgi:thimet oligopeptidase
MRDHCTSCPIIDESLVQRIRAAKKFGSGVDYGRQLLYASFDMALSGEGVGSRESGVVDRSLVSSPTPDARHPTPESFSLRLWKQMEGSTPMGYVDGTAFPGTFEHIASGYAAGYYGYMWAKVIALDLISAFGPDVMNEATGRRFRELILSRGSEEPARDLVERFLGRPVSSDAFFAEIRGE